MFSNLEENEKRYKRGSNKKDKDPPTNLQENRKE